MKRMLTLVTALLWTAPAALHASEQLAVPRMTPQKLQNPVVLSPTTITCLMATDAMRTPGIPERPADSKLRAKHYWLTQFGGGQRVAWQITVSQAGDYRPTFIVNCGKDTEIVIVGPRNRVVFLTPESGWQRSAAAAALQLDAGVSTLTVEVRNAVIEFKGIDLVCVAAEAAINQRIQEFRGDTSWMKVAGYGIMVQGGGWCYPAKGNRKPWPGFAEDFDAKRFVEEVHAMGGRYLVWSATWSDYLFPAPIRAIGEVLPARISRRDLIGDLIEECRKHDIRFMLYYHLGHDVKEVLVAKGWKDADEQDSASRCTWLERENKIFAEIGRRYGTGLDAIFLDDGCVWYPADFERLGNSLKAGNPRRVICYNPWILPSLTPFQDFWCGENFTGEKTPYPLENGVVKTGPQEGLQLFGNFMFDGPDWGINRANVIIQNTCWTADQIVRQTMRLERERYSVAFNLLLYEDGSMNPHNVAVLTEAARLLRRGKWAAP